MPYSKSNKQIQDSAFKMKGYSYPGASPMKKDEADTKVRTRRNIFTGGKTVIETQKENGVTRKIKTKYKKDGTIKKQTVIKKGGGGIKLNLYKK